MRRPDPFDLKSLDTNIEMKSIFRLYKSDGAADAATIFDLIVGSGSEPRQTKALGYVLSRSDVLLKAFLKMPSIQITMQSFIGRSRPKFDQYIVDAEMVGADETGGVRADLVLRFFLKGAPQFALLIEAKSAKQAGAGDRAVVEQITRYVSGQVFSGLLSWPVVPVALTRTRRVLNNIASVTWNDLIELVHLNSGYDTLLKEYLHFLKHIGDDMHFFEREVLSVPAGGTAKVVEETCIHACPDIPSFSYKIPLRIAFRHKGGGFMKRLYKVLDILSFDPLDPVERQAALESSLNEDERTRLDAYMKARDRDFGWGNRGEPFRFYILSSDDIIELPHEPRPIRNTQGQVYFRLCDILDRGSEIVRPMS